MEYCKNFNESNISYSQNALYVIVFYEILMFKLVAGSLLLNFMFGYNFFQVETLLFQNSEKWPKDKQCGLLEVDVTLLKF